MDEQHKTTTCCYKSDYDCRLHNYSEEALIEQDGMPLCFPDPSTASPQNVIQCPGLYDGYGTLDRDNEALTETTYGGGSIHSLPPNSSTSHIAYPSDEFSTYGNMAKIYGCPPMQAQQLMYSQVEKQQALNTCHYNILEYTCGHSIPNPTLPYISHINTCHHMALEIPYMACQNMGVASLSNSTKSCHACQGADQKKRNQAPKVDAMLNPRPTMNETRSDISVADIDSNIKGEKYKVLWRKRSEAEDTEFRMIQGAYVDAHEIRKDIFRQGESKMSDVLRRASVLRDSRLKVMQDIASQNNPAVSGRSRLTLASRLPLHHSMRKEGMEDAENKKRMLRQEKDGMKGMETKDSKGKSSSKMFSIPKEKLDSTNYKDQSEWFSRMWSDLAHPDLADSTVPELVTLDDIRGEDKVAADKYWTGAKSQFLNDIGNPAVLEKPKMSATEMLKGVCEKDAKLSKMRMAARALPFQPSLFTSTALKQSTKLDAMSQGSHTQPKMPAYISKATQMTEDVAMYHATQTQRRKCTYVSQGTQTMDNAALSQTDPSQTSALPVQAAQEYACKVADERAAISVPQVQLVKPTMVSMGTQTDDHLSVEMDPAVKGEKESEWEDMDLNKSDKAEDGDWEFFDM